jgi:hypothetical protein
VVQGVIRLRNLAWLYYLAHLAEVRNKILESVAYTAGVSNDDINVTASQQVTVSGNSHAFELIAVTGAGVDVGYSITTDSDQIADSIEASLTEQTNSGTLELPLLATLPTDSKVDPTSSAAGDPASSGSDGGSGSSTGLRGDASIHGANLMLVVALFAVALML